MVGKNALRSIPSNPAPNTDARDELARAGWLHVEPNRMRTKRIGLVLGLLLFAGLGYLMRPFIVGGGQMETFCNSLKSGATIDDVMKAVSDRGYRLALGKEPLGLIHDPRSFGRFICEVHFEGGHLNSAKYIYND